jgi:hypothetical protein
LQAQPVLALCPGAVQEDAAIGERNQGQLNSMLSPHRVLLREVLLSTVLQFILLRLWIDQNACRFFLYESGFALFVALLINIAVVSVSGTVCYAGNISPKDAEKCSDLTLDTSSFLLKAIYFITTGLKLLQGLLLF